MHLNRTIKIHFCRSAQRLAQNRFFDLELMFVACVLIMAAAAAREIGASRLDAVRRRFENPTCDGSSKPRFLLGQFPLDFLAFQHEWDENRLAAALLV